MRARPATARYRAGRFVVRHRLAALAAALAVVSLLGGLTAALWQARVAQVEAQRAERARGFLVEMFESLDPVQARSQAVTPAKLLAAGVRRADRELEDEPAFQAEMLDLLASLHRKLGLLPEGRVLAERSLTLRRRLFGESSAEAAQSLVTLGWIRLNQGEPVAARALLERAVADLERTEGRDSLVVADAREPLLEAMFFSGDGEAILPLLEHRLATYRRILGDAHEKTGMAWSDRGVLLDQLGRMSEAEADYRKALAVLQARLPADDPRLAYPHHNLGSLLLGRGRTDEAERELRTAYELRRRALGDRHPETAMNLLLLSKALVDKRQYKEAEAAARKVGEILTDKDRFGAGNSRITLAQILLYQERHAEAIAMFDRGIAELEPLVGPRHSLILGARAFRAETLLAMGRRKEGLAGWRSVIDALRDARRGRRRAARRAALQACHRDSRRWRGRRGPRDAPAKPAARRAELRGRALPGRPDRLPDCHRHPPRSGLGR